MVCYKDFVLVEGHRDKYYRSLLCSVIFLLLNCKFFGYIFVKLFFIVLEFFGLVVKYSLKILEYDGDVCAPKARDP